MNAQCGRLSIQEHVKILYYWYAVTPVTKYIGQYAIYNKKNYAKL